MSVHTDIADFVLGLIDPGGGPWAHPFTAQRAWTPTLQPGDLETAVASVVPLRAERSLAARKRDQTDYDVAILLQQNTDGASASGTDARITVLDALAEEFMAAVTRQNPAGAEYLRVVRDPVLDPDTIFDHQVFSTVITITYRVTSAV